MNDERLICQHCGRRTDAGEQHVRGDRGWCLAARVTWYRDARETWPTVEKVGEFPPRPAMIPGPKKGL